MGTRKTVLKALRARVIRAAVEKNVEGLLTEEAEQAADALAAVTVPEGDLKAAYWLGMFHWLRYIALPEGAAQRELAAAVRFFAPVYQDDPDVVPAALRDRYQWKHRNGDAGADPTEMTEHANDLVHAYQSGGGLPLLTEAVSLFRAAADATPTDDPDHAMRLSNLGSALRMQFERTRDADLLTEALEMQRAAVAGVPVIDPSYGVTLSGLANTLASLYEHTGDVERIIEAVEVGRAAVAAISSEEPNRSTTLSNLGAFLTRLFECTGPAALLAEAVEMHRAAVAATPTGHFNRGSALSNLGATLQAQFEHIGDRDLLTEAIDVLRAGVAATSTDSLDHGTVLSHLAVALTRLSECTGDTALLAEAVETGRTAVAAPADGADRPMRLSNLGSALMRLSERRGDVGLLTDSVEMHRAAVAATPLDHPNHSGYLSCLGLALQALFERTGDTGPLTEAVEVHRAAVGTTASGNPSRSIHLSSRGIALQALFERIGDTGLLTEAVAMHRAAVDASPPDHPNSSGYLNNLGAALQALFERTGDTGLLAEAVALHRAAVDASPPDNPNSPGYLNNLGAALKALYEQSGVARVLTQAIEAHRAAVKSASTDSPDRSKALSNLGLVLQTLFQQTGDTSLLAEAVHLLRTAVEVTSADHPDHATYLSNLGNLLQVSFEHGGDRASLLEASNCYMSAAENSRAPALARIWAYRQVARLAGSDSAGALVAVEAAVNLLPRMSPRTLVRPDREHQLGQLAGLAGDVAAAAVSAGRPDRALELLEQTRGILVADTLQARTADLARLRATAPDLAKDFEDLRIRLDYFDRSGSQALRVDFATASDSQHGHGAAQQAIEDLSRSREEVHAAWKQLIDRIRTVDENFLHAQGVDQLVAQAQDGPVVFIYTSSTRCDALILSADRHASVRVVPLVDLTERTVYQQANRLLDARRTADDDAFDAMERIAAQTEILDILAWMWDTITSPVLTELGYTTPPSGNAWPQMWWCPVGILAYLPLHAAGYHMDHIADNPVIPANPRTVLDRVVSSYTTTLRGLAYARNHQPEATPKETVIIAAPDVTDFQPLEQVTAEANVIAELTPGAYILPEPTHDRVLAALPRHAAAHFACHGYTNWSDPAASRLILRDNKTAPLNIADIMELQLTGALAYLSACETSVTSPNLADEAVHITGAFHLAGYQHVIGTLWSVDDVKARDIAIDVYTRLTREGTTAPDAALSACALHHAIRNLRTRYPRTPTFWAGHTHTGT